MDCAWSNLDAQDSAVESLEEKLRGNVKTDHR